jgi:hypothetical protein
MSASGPRLAELSDAIGLQLSANVITKALTPKRSFLSVVGELTINQSRIDKPQAIGAHC